MGFINQLSNLRNVLEKLSNIPAASPVSQSPGPVKRMISTEIDQ